MLDVVSVELMEYGSSLDESIGALLSTGWLVGLQSV